MTGKVPETKAVFVHETIPADWTYETMRLRPPCEDVVKSTAADMSAFSSKAAYAPGTESEPRLE